jgi:hypothetical protein
MVRELQAKRARVGASLAFFCVKASVQPLIFAQLKIHN